MQVTALLNVQAQDNRHRQHHHARHRRSRRRARSPPREVERYAQNLPEGSYGRHNREAIAARETRVATRLRAVEQAYRTANERDIDIEPTEATPVRRSHEHSIDREIEAGLEQK